MNNIPYEALDMACYSLRKHIPELTPEILQDALKKTKEAPEIEKKPGTHLTVSEVAERLSISRPTVFRWIKSNKIKSVCFGERCRPEGADSTARCVESLAGPGREA